MIQSISLEPFKWLSEPPQIPKKPQCLKGPQCPCSHHKMSQSVPPKAQERIIINSMVKVAENRYSLSLLDETLRGELYITQQQFEEIEKQIPIYVNGEAKITGQDGFIRDGNFKDGLLNGQGKIQQNNGIETMTRFEGQFVDGLLHGQGRINELYGIAEGIFENGQLNGQGKYTDFRGNIYLGLFKDGDITEGKIISIYGTVGEGQIKYKSLNGPGKLTSRDGIVWEGIFEDSQLQGEGKETRYGVIRTGYFKNTQLVRLDSITYENGSIHEGKFNYQQELQGEGTVSQSNGQIEKGNFLYGILHGFGTLILKNNLKYSGSFHQKKLIVKSIQGRKKLIVKVIRI